MTPLLPVVAFIGALAITAPVWAQGIPAPDTASGGAVVLRGSRVTPLATRTTREKHSLPIHQSISDASPPGWNPNFDTSGFNRNFDTSGFDRNFDRTGLTR
jgi:hypothetical protein